MSIFLMQTQLHRLLDPERLVAAIRVAESGCSAEIRVSVSGAWWGDPQVRARKAFARLGMEKTRHRNGVLIFLMPHRKRFAVLGDTGIHAAVGQPFWDALSAEMSGRFQAGDFTGGLEQGIAALGRALASHFPAAEGDNPNELPDELDRDPDLRLP